VDDSTASQVYNNIFENELSRAAVEATSGEILALSGEIFPAYFFSSSCGFTAGAGDVWASGEDFPAKSPEGLRSKAVFREEMPLPDTEDAFLDFFRGEGEYKKLYDSAYESEVPYFRWEAHLDAKALRENMLKEYSGLGESEKEKYFSADPAELGPITGIYAAARGAGGNITKLLISGEEGAAAVKTEGMIRKILRPGKLILSNGKEVAQGMLPSSFFAVHSIEDDKIILCGGGFGHGVGLSQSAAGAMAAEGKNYREILDFFFSPAEVVKRQEG
ncbi:MAG: SpoIID/LytB domain-containing protein, partial [Firmicutes bacterium]|nr:SpoIID/LytB domain-containing protein [Bacillota bacterium]